MTGSTAGSRCASPSYSSSFDCPSSCTWTPQQLSGQCAGLALPEVPVNRGPAAACLLHPPCSAAAAGNLTAPDGPCFCCDLQLDGGAAATAAAAAGGTVPPAQLWVLFLGQLAFLLWVLLLTRAQVGGLNARGGCWKRAMEANGSGAHSPARLCALLPLSVFRLLQLRAVHAADARVITASDFTVLLSGVPTSLSPAELHEWCSHYGSGAHVGTQGGGGGADGELERRGRGAACAAHARPCTVRRLACSRHSPDTTLSLPPPP